MNQVDEALEQIESHESQQPINIELLSQLADYFENHPKEFDMYEWGKTKKGKPIGAATLLGQSIPFYSEYTVGCIACHTVRLGGGDVNGANYPAQAQRLLNLTFEQAQRLFYVQNWPEPFASNYRENKAEPTGRAWIASERVRYFIATAGAV